MKIDDVVVNSTVTLNVEVNDEMVIYGEKGKIVVTAQTQLFLGDHFEIKAIDADENEWLIHSTNGVKLGQRIGLFFDPEDIHVMRLNESQADFDARIEKYEGDENED